MGKPKPLSKRQKGILDYINMYLGENGRPPTIREIGKAVEISSTSVVNYNLTRLKERGLLERDAEVSRGLRLTTKTRSMYGAVADAATNSLDRLGEGMGRLVRIKLAGTIVAGEPIDVPDSGFEPYDDDDAVELSVSMLPGKPDRLFALQVSGNSMIDAMVNDGDIVVMQQQETAQNGDMVAVWLDNDGTTTLKHFFHEGDRIRLQPANPTMEPIYVAADQVQIQGKVMMVLRQTA